MLLNVIKSKIVIQCDRVLESMSRVESVLEEKASYVNLRRFREVSRFASDVIGGYRDYLIYADLSKAQLGKMLDRLVFVDSEIEDRFQCECKRKFVDELLDEYIDSLVVLFEESDVYFVVK